MIFSNTLIDDELELIYVGTVPGLSTWGILFKVYSRNDKITFDYTAVTSDKPISAESLKEDLTIVNGTLNKIPISLLKLCVRFESRFEKWLTGQVSDTCFLVNDSSAVISRRI